MGSSTFSSFQSRIAQPWIGHRLYQVGLKSLENDSLPSIFLGRSTSRSVAEDFFTAIAENKAEKKNQSSTMYFYALI